MLRKRNLNVQNNVETVKDLSLAVKRKNSNLKNAPVLKPRKAAFVHAPALPEILMLEEDPVPDYDFDKECERDPNAMAQYARDIFIYYKYREQFFKVGNYFARQQFLDRDARLKMVDWLVEVQETFELNHETLYLSVKLLDIYLDNVPNVELDRLQLVASAAVFVASKFDERSPPLIDDFIYLSNEHYTRDEIIVMERDFLRSVHFDLGAPLSYGFLRRYARVTKLDMTTLTLARYILETSLMFLDFCRVSESLMGLASYLLAVRMKKIGDWTPVLQKYSGFKREQVEPLCTALNHMIVRCRRDMRIAQTIYNKYSHEIFFEVALTPSLPDELPASAPISPPANMIVNLH